MDGRARAEKIPIEALFQQIDATNICWGWAVWGPKVSFILGTDGATKSDEFSEKVQTALDPPPSFSFYIAIFYN